MAAFHSDFVVSILSNQNKPYREVSEDYNRVCRVPFDQEYKVRLKNKTLSRAYATVEIDGTDISPGRQFVLSPGQTLDLERFLIDGDLDQGKRFKFMSVLKGTQTGEIQDPTNLDNGLVRVTFHPEAYPVTTFSKNIGGMLRGMMGVTQGYGAASGSTFSINSGGVIGTNTASMGDSNSSTGIYVNSTPTNEVGATAEGSDSTQKFQDSYETFPTLMPVTIDIRLKGPKEKSRTDWKIQYVNNQPQVFFKQHLLPVESIQMTSEGLMLQIKNFEIK